MVRFVLAAALLAGCVNPSLLPQSTTPEPVEPTAGGTLACNQILEECDRNCAEPTCVEACGTRGTPDAQRLHGALVACAKTSGCLEQTCVMERCGAEIQACQADTTGAATAEAPAPSAPPAPDTASTVEDQPAALAGTWSHGSISVTGWEGPNGAWKPGTGSGSALRLDPDGRFEKAAMLETTVGACTTSAFQWSTGRWSADGATFTLREEKSRFRFADGCNPGKNYENSPDLETDVRRYELSQDHATHQPVLKLFTKDGNADTYYK